MKVKSLSHVGLLATPWTAAYQAPPWDFLGKSTGVGCHCLLCDECEESEKASLRLSIQKAKIIASGLITSWQIDGETMETVRDFIWAPKSLQVIIAATKLKDTCSLKEKL